MIKIVAIVGLIIWGIVIVICKTIRDIKIYEDFNYWNNYDKIKEEFKELIEEENEEE